MFRIMANRVKRVGAAGNLFDRQPDHLPLGKAILKPTHPVAALAQQQFWRRARGQDDVLL